MSDNEPNVYIERSLTLADLKVFNQKCLDKFVDMERSKIRIVDDCINPLVSNLRLIVPAHMDPTEFQDVLMRMRLRIEIPYRKFGELVVAHGKRVKELCSLITVYDCASTNRWWFLIKKCEELKPCLEERISEFLSATNQAEKVLFL